MPRSDCVGGLFVARNTRERPSMWVGYAQQVRTHLGQCRACGDGRTVISSRE